MLTAPSHSATHGNAEGNGGSRWLDFLAEFPRLSIIYKPGSENSVADALSHNPAQRPSPTHEGTSKLRTEQFGTTDGKQRPSQANNASDREPSLPTACPACEAGGSLKVIVQRVNPAQLHRILGGKARSGRTIRPSRNIPSALYALEDTDVSSAPLERQGRHGRERSEPAAASETAWGTPLETTANTNSDLAPRTAMPEDGAQTLATKQVATDRTEAHAHTTDLPVLDDARVALQTSWNAHRYLPSNLAGFWGSQHAKEVRDTPDLQRTTLGSVRGRHNRVGRSPA